MIKTVSVGETQTRLHGLLARARDNGDETIIGENGEPLAKITLIEKPKEQKQRVVGLGKGTIWMSDDFDDELPDEFWGFDKE